MITLQEVQEYLDSGVCNTEFVDVEDVQLPSRMGRGNVAWPPGTRPEQAAYWRAMMEMEGPIMPHLLSTWEIDMPDWYSKCMEQIRRDRIKAMRRQWWRWLLMPWRS